MAGSSYQILRLIERLRHARGDSAPHGAEDSAAIAAVDRVRLSEKAREQSAQIASMIRLPPGTPVAVASIVDQESIPLPTRIELERRAGSFMHPPQQPVPGPVPIPRARRPFPKTVVTEVTDADDMD